jgi:hypothetical protein
MQNPHIDKFFFKKIKIKIDVESIFDRFDIMERGY